jgi:hypothetical protein
LSKQAAVERWRSQHGSQSAEVFAAGYEAALHDLKELANHKLDPKLRPPIHALIAALRTGKDERARR